jgi:hypothetical protein
MGPLLSRFAGEDKELLRDDDRIKSGHDEKEKELLA